jgi:hypothetical protein
MKKILIIVFTLFHSFIYAQQYATASILESEAGRKHSKIVVVYGNDESEVIPLNSWSPLVTGENGTKLIIENQKIINKFLQKMKEKNYKILNITSKEKSISSTQVSLTFIIFEKMEK